MEDMSKVFGSEDLKKVIDSDLGKKTEEVSKEAVPGAPKKDLDAPVPAEPVAPATK